MLMMLAFGIGFEFPVLLVFLAARRRAHPATALGRSALRDRGIFVVVAVATPSGDPYSLLALSVPMFIFYEVAIVIGSSCSGTARGARRRPRRDRGRHRGSSRRVPRRLRLRARRLPDSARSTRSTPGQSVLVAAPTGVGQDGRRRVRGRPGARRGQQGLLHGADQGAVEPEVRATSSRRHGAKHVGLLTGDNSINGDAPVVVMTTEVLRNMIYAACRRARRDLAFVVLDEVHFLQDTYRGPVWEEVIIHLPHRRAAGVPVGHRVSNAEELADWIDHRPRPDRGDHRGAPAGRAREPLPDRRPDAPTDCTCCPRSSTAARTRRPSRLDDEARCAAQWPGALGADARRLFTPRRVEVVELLDERRDAAGDLLHLQPQPRATTPPTACLDAGLRLTTADERDRIREIVERPASRPRPTPTSPCSATTALLAGLEAGIAAHHAGHGPAVQGGRRGLLRRRAREGRVRHRDARGRHQHAGTIGRDREADEVHRRAPRSSSRRGSTRSSPVAPDGAASTTLGYAIVLWSPFVPFDQVAALAGEPHVPPHLGVPADVQHGRQPRALATPASRPTTCSTCRSPSTRPTATWCGSKPGSSGARRTSPTCWQTAREPVRRHRRVPPAAIAERRAAAVATPSAATTSSPRR